MGKLQHVLSQNDYERVREALAKANRLLAEKIPDELKELFQQYNAMSIFIELGEAHGLTKTGKATILEGITQLETLILFMEDKNNPTKLQRGGMGGNSLQGLESRPGG